MVAVYHGYGDGQTGDIDRWAAVEGDELLSRSSATTASAEWSRTRRTRRRVGLVRDARPSPNEGLAMLDPFHPSDVMARVRTGIRHSRWSGS